MGYTNRRVTMKLWYLHTNKVNYFSSAKFNEHNNKFGKGWSPSSELTTETNVYKPPTLKLIF